MSATEARSVLILYEGQGNGGDFGRSFAAGLRAHGYETLLLPRSADWEGAPDLVLAYGPFGAAGSMLPVARHLLRRGERRPRFIWWLTEGVPALWLPRWSVVLLGRARVWLDQAIPSHNGQVWARGHRLRICGELRRLQAQGVLDVLAVTSALRAAYLRRAGFEPVVVPLGYDADTYGCDLGVERDIDVCFVGKVDSRRRRVLLEREGTQLAKRGIRLTIATDLYGEARTHFLNRSKIMLNILRAPHDFVGQRLMLGAANQALVVSEPMLDIAPFVDGKHLVISPLATLAETIEYYLAHDSERSAIAMEAYRFVRTHLTIEQMIGKLLSVPPQGNAN